jgi:5-formyltetrahydrofolate cyclo-ligase
MQIAQIRQHYRRLRRELDADQQQSNAHRIAVLIDRFVGLRRDLRISAYLAFQGEISLKPWIDTNRQRQRIYLPKLYETTAPRLRFAPLNDDTRWARDRFGILEPRVHWGKTLAAHRLDMMLVPLVAFDRAGHRLGMGGGYYDRSIGFRRSRTKWTRPLLVGVAHSLQEHDGLPQMPWDAPLDAIITEREIIWPGLANPNLLEE